MSEVRGYSWTNRNNIQIKKLKTYKFASLDYQQKIEVLVLSERIIEELRAINKRIEV